MPLAMIRALTIICIVVPWSHAIVQKQRYHSLKKFDQRYQFEQSIRSRGYPYVVGCDDTGRGSIAGPVMTAACCLLLKPSLSSDDVNAILQKEAEDVFSLVKDSKVLTDAMRNTIYQKILNKSDLYAYSFAQRDAQDIDRLNVQKASMECFAESIETLVTEYKLPFNETYCLVDGIKSPKLMSSIPCRPFVQGDTHILTISMASILAKVKRDQYMITEAHRLYPCYGFDINKGYATRDHIMAIHKHGPSPLHRMTFRSLKGR